MLRPWLVTPLLLMLLSSAAAASPLPAPQAFAPLGAYIGCFDLSRLLVLPGMEDRPGKQFSATTVRECVTGCRAAGHVLAIITPAYRCWCTSSAPEPASRLDDGACTNESGGGAAVLFDHIRERPSHCATATGLCRQHGSAATPATNSLQQRTKMAIPDIFLPLLPLKSADAASESCKLEALTPMLDALELHQPGDAGRVTPDASLGGVTLHTEGALGARISVRGSDMTAGLLEAVALLPGTPGVSAALALRSLDVAAAATGGDNSSSASAKQDALGFGGCFVRVYRCVSAWYVCTHMRTSPVQPTSLNAAAFTPTLLPLPFCHPLRTYAPRWASVFSNDAPAQPHSLILKATKGCVK
jgi:WSC domain